jgi:hypothetical protein
MGSVPVRSTHPDPTRPIPISTATTNAPIISHFGRIGPVVLPRLIRDRSPSCAMSTPRAYERTNLIWTERTGNLHLKFRKAYAAPLDIRTADTMLTTRNYEADSSLVATSVTRSL